MAANCKLTMSAKDQAETLASRLGTEPVYLTNDRASWYILVKRWMPSSDDEAFAKEWELHPDKRHALKLSGKMINENRWSQSWGFSYSYSGSTNKARPVQGGTMVSLLMDKVNDLVRGVFYQEKEAEPPYNGCLQNWYEPPDTIGLHADDETDLRPNFPIFSLSWGGTRRFLFRTRECRKDKIELLLEDGDLLVMGGTCQQTHTHEVPKVRTTMDPPTADRINWTIRAFAPTEKEEQAEGS